MPVENRLGEEGSGFRLAMTMLDRSRPMVAAIALGIARAAYEYALRVREDAHPVRQADRRESGDPVHAGRHGDQGAGGAADDLVVGESNRDGAPLPLREQHGQELRLGCGDGVTTDAVQIFGGYGYIREYPVEKLFRDAKITQIYEGTNQIQKIVVAKQILK